MWKRKKVKKQWHRDEIFPKNSRVNPFDHRRNEEVLEKLQVEPVDEKLRKYKSNWLRYVTKMDTNKMPELMLNYLPNGRRPLGRPLKRLLDEADSGLSRPNSCRMIVVVVMMMMMTTTFLTRSLVLAWCTSLNYRSYCQALMSVLLCNINSVPFLIICTSVCWTADILLCLNLL